MEKLILKEEISLPEDIYGYIVSSQPVQGGFGDSGISSGVFTFDKEKAPKSDVFKKGGWIVRRFMYGFPNGLFVIKGEHNGDSVTNIITYSIVSDRAADTMFQHKSGFRKVSQLNIDDIVRELSAVTNNLPILDRQYVSDTFLRYKDDVLTFLRLADVSVFEWLLSMIASFFTDRDKN